MQCIVLRLPKPAALVCLGVMMSLLGCEVHAGPTTPGPASFNANPWPQANHLFRQSNRWLGGDAASSIPLGESRSLWLFGDSFVADQVEGDRSKARMVHNSIAVQWGRDPSQSRFHQYWQFEGPSAFFAGSPGEWLWPAHGVRTGNALTIFMSRVRRAQNQLGFQVVGWTALRVEDPDRSPAAWQPRSLPVPRTNFPVLVGVSVLRENGWVYAFAVHEPGTHDVFLLRWPEWAVARGQLLEPEWWGGQGWIPHAQLQHPFPVIRNAAAEFSVSHHPSIGYVQVQSVGFPAGDLAVRVSRQLVGPWSEPIIVYRAPEAGEPNAMIYAGKGHAQLAGADLVATYIASSLEGGKAMQRSELYYPRFVRINWR